MKKETKQSSAYRLARQRLLERVAELSAAGTNCLPGLRPLCKELGVSFMTANKAVKNLAKEGHLQIIPCKGVYIVEKPKYFNIALMMDGETDKIFINCPAVLRGILDVLDAGPFLLHILHHPHADRAKLLLRDYKLDACIWYLPEPKLYSMISDIERIVKIPVMPVIHDWDLVRESELPPCHVATDYHGIGRMRAEFMLKRGHRKIARFNAYFPPSIGSDESEGVKGFIAALKDAGVKYNSAWAVSPEDSFTGIKRLLDEGEITAAVVNGGVLNMERVFQAIDSHKNAGKIELLVDWVGPKHKELIARHPRLKIVGVNHHPVYELGAESAKAVAGYLEKGIPLKSMKIKGEIISNQ